MNEFHQHLSKQLAEHLTKRAVVVWYDPRREFTGFIAELCDGAAPDLCQIAQVTVANVEAQLCCARDSLYRVKFAVDDCTAVDQPGALIIYLPGYKPEEQISPLAELDLGGMTWEPQLKREARRVLKSRYGDGQIDQMLVSENVTYADIARLSQGGPGGRGEQGALLSVIFAEARGDNASTLACWLGDPAHDPTIVEKAAEAELRQLIASRLGLEIGPEMPLDESRRRVARYVLLGEFRNDLRAEPPAAVQMVPRPATKDQTEMLRRVAHELRRRYPAGYVTLADAIEQEFSLPAQSIRPEVLGEIDTFRFEEALLLGYTGQLIFAGQYDAALKMIRNRRHSFWALHDFRRQEQWRACELMAELGQAVDTVGHELPAPGTPPAQWVECYAAPDGWFRVDLLHRRLESAQAAMSQDVESEQALCRVRSEYDALVGKMTRGFVGALEGSAWTIPGQLHQTSVYSRKVVNGGGAVAYFLVDAMRYEMGVELSRQLEGAEQLSLEPALAAIPTITPVGMAALLPGAEGSFSVVEDGGKLSVRVDGALLSDLQSRRKAWKGRVPGVVEVELEKMPRLSTSQLRKKIEGAPLLLVHSVTIDEMGERLNDLMARQMIDTAIANIARAIKRLAGLGIARFVIVADHGHIFGEARDESQRIDSPGGDTVELHRRCWVGRGGTNPVATVRVHGAQLGYDTDLDFIFPAGDGVFKAGGDLSYYHGGLSLQELVVPVLCVRMAAAGARDDEADWKVSLTGVPERIASRIVRVDIQVQKGLFTGGNAIIRPVLLHQGAQVGHASIALDATLDAATHRLTVDVGKTCTVGLQLLRDDVPSVKVVILDPNSDRILTETKDIPVKLGI